VRVDSSHTVLGGVSGRFKAYPCKGDGPGVCGAGVGGLGLLGYASRGLHGDVPGGPAGRMMAARSSSPVLLAGLGREGNYPFVLELPAKQPTTGRPAGGAGEIGSPSGVETGKSTKTNEISRLGKTPRY